MQPVYLFSGVSSSASARRWRACLGLPQASLRWVHFGHDEGLLALLDERATAAATDDALLDCDGCAFQQAAAEHVHPLMGMTPGNGAAPDLVTITTMPRHPFRPMVAVAITHHA